MKQIIILFVGILLYGCAFTPKEIRHYETREVEVKVDIVPNVQEICRYPKRVIGCLKNGVIILPLRGGKEGYTNYGNVKVHMYAWDSGPCFIACVKNGKIHLAYPLYNRRDETYVGDAVAKALNIEYKDHRLLGHEFLHYIYGPHRFERKYKERMEQKYKLEKLKQINM